MNSAISRLEKRKAVKKLTKADLIKRLMKFARKPYKPWIFSKKHVKNMSK